jgi:cobalamin transport system substrate-binding protein
LNTRRTELLRMPKTRIHLNPGRINGADRNKVYWTTIKSSVSALAVSALLLMPLLWSGCAPAPARADSSPSSGLPLPERIISTAPSITETVFALGAGEKLVGVTKFCKYPPRAGRLPKVGGLLDPAGEAIVRLKPDLVIVLEENNKFRQELSSGGYRVIAVDHKSIEGIISSIETIGAVCGRTEQGLRLADRIRKTIERMESAQNPKKNRPKVIVSVGRNAGNGQLGKVYIAGKDNYYGKMIQMAGGVNAYNGNIRYPAVSIEGLLRMNPDVIIDLVTDYRDSGLKEENLLEEWTEVRGTSAYESGQVYVMGEDFWTLPGPRFIRIVEELSQILDK